VTIIQNDSVCINARANYLTIDFPRTNLRIGIDSGDSTQDATFISHAHADHVDFLRKSLNEATFDADFDGSSRCGMKFQEKCIKQSRYNIITSNDTQRLLCSRYPSMAKNWRVCDEKALFPSCFSDSKIQLLESGHTLGSRALAIVDRQPSIQPSTSGMNGGIARFLYTGDFFVQEGRLLSPLKPVKCEIMACECTFGMSFYEFPPFDVLKQEIMDWIADSLNKGPVVLYGNSLGKNQELLSLLEPFSNDCSIIADEETCMISDLYKEANITLTAHDPYKKYSRSKFFERNPRWILVLPLGARFNDRYHKINDIQCQRAIFSGWTLDKNWLERWNVDAGFPLSDHASFSDLVSFIETCAPADLLLVHGNGTILKGRLKEREYIEMKSNLSRDMRISAMQHNSFE